MSNRILNIEQLRDSKLLYEKKIPPFAFYMILIFVCLISAVIVWSIYTPKAYVIKSTGTVVSEDKNYIMSPYAGKIVSNSLQEGMLVDEGDVIYKIQSTELDLQNIQLQGQKELYENNIAQYKKLVKSIEDDENYFDTENEEDLLYYSMYESYKSQVSQQKIDVTTYKAYGYTDEQIDLEFEKNQGKISEIYYSTIVSAEESIQQCMVQLKSIEAQIDAINSGKSDYAVTANASGRVHVITEYKENMVVQSGTVLGSISTEKSDCKIEAYVSSEDAVRIKVGDKVDIAVYGVAQSVYGTISGRIDAIDCDITTSESQNSENTTSYFKVKVIPDYTYLVDGYGDKVELTNGTQVETRVIYKKVSYFNYVLDMFGLLSK